MARYRYKAKNKEGKTVRGRVEADNDAEFYDRMGQQELYCISMQSDAKAKASRSGKKIKTKTLSIFCRELSVLLASGMNLLAAMRLLYDREEKEYVKNSYMQIIESVEKGDTLYEALRKQGEAYPRLFRAMVLAGESSGNIDVIMEKMAVYYEKEAALKSKIGNAMIYPIILIVVTVVVVLVLFTFVLPKFFDMFEGQEVPAITAVFMGISHFITEKWYIILFVILGIICIGKALSAGYRTAEKMDAMMLSIPVIGKLLSKILMGHFANAMSILYASGITIVKCLEIGGETISNRYIVHKLALVREKVEKGVSLSQAMQAENLFDRMFWSMVHTGEESGNLETMFFKLSDYLERESEDAVQKIMAIIEPAVLIIIAVVIGLVVASVLLPLYGMSMY
jgi:type IV pilus assembly protein PilC